MEEHDDNIGTINFRLSQIESSLQDVKDLLVSVKMAGKDIQELQGDYKTIEERVKKCEQDIAEIRQMPEKKSAERWQYILDYIFKFTISAAVIYFAKKMGVR